MSIKQRIAAASATLALTVGAMAGMTGSANAAVGAPQIVEGDSGFNVYCAQWGAYWWVQPTYNVQTDGSFGPVTLQLIEDFQEQWKLHIDGQVGPDTGSDIWWVIQNQLIPARGNFMTPWGVPISNCYQVLPTHT
jgi:peptidoglycan hydrolase-like protein with peptidoglycan-binding domain